LLTKLHAYRVKCKRRKKHPNGGGDLETASHFNWEFETITQHTLDILLIVDQVQIVQYATPSIETLLGFRHEEIIGKNAFEPLHPEDREKLMKSHRDVIITQEPKVDEYRVFHRNGSIKYVESRTMPIPNQADKLVVVSIRDITSRKSIEMELENRKNRYQDLQSSLKNYSKDLSTVLNMSELKTRLMQELIKIIPDSEPQMIVYHRLTQMMEGDLDGPGLSYFPQLVAGKLHRANDRLSILIGDRKDGAYILTIKAISSKESMDLIWFETLVNYTIMVFESLNVIEDLMNQLEMAIQKKDRPRWIVRLLFHLSEKKRWELSSDLHDTVLQNQLDLYRRLEAIVMGYEFEKEMDDRLQEIIKGLMDTIYQIQMTCNELRPPMLRELGLVTALGNLFEQTQLSSTFKITFTTENTAGLSLTEEETISIYRIVQELLNNASKHSQATNLHFYFKKLDNRIELQYSDNGIGLNVDRLTPSFNSMGLSGMRERIQSLNGHIEFHSKPENGLFVKMQIPISV
jgi:two-component system, NarL family, sensor histidine kinase ComP